MGTDSDTKEVYNRAFSVRKCKRTYFSMLKRRDYDTWRNKIATVLLHAVHVLLME